jgi:hypothetical protein
MTLRSIQLHLAAAIFAVAALTLTGPSARAFTMENLSASDGNSRFADPDDQVKNGVRPFGQGGPSVQFGMQPAQPGSQFLHVPSAGFAPSQPPPEPYNLNNRN